MATAFERTQNSKTVARPGYGNKGRDINLFANFYRMKFNPRITVYQYDIEVEPKCPKFMTRRLFHHFAKENKASHFGNGLPVYDGNKNVYSSIELPGVGETPVAIEVALPDQPDCRGGTFTIKIKFATKIDMSCLEQILKGTGFGDVPQETLVIADIVVRHFPSLRYTVAGRGLFQKPTKDSKHVLSPFTEMWSGIYTSARPSNMGLVLNVDESHTAFYSAQAVLDFMVGHLELRQGINANYSLRDSDRASLEKQLKFLKVSVVHQAHKRQYRVEKLTKETVSQLSFDVDGQRMSISQYFKKQYNYTLKYPNLPCVWVSPREKKTYLPLEVCHIVEGQRCVRKLTPNETSSMIRATAKKPGIRKQCTDGQLQKMEYSKDPFVKQFGFQVDQSMVQVKGKILDPPKVGYGNNATCQPNAGVWDNRGKQFFKPVNIKNWAILMFPSQNQCQTADVKAFCEVLIKVGRDNGMQIAQPSLVKYLRENEVENVCREILQKSGGKIDLVYCILPRNSAGVYPRIKNVFENVNCISTQCMELKNLKPPKPQTIGNILQKINTKIGGTNNISANMMDIPLFKQPVIIMGADNSHPAQGEGNRPSITAIVGSLDRHACRYGTQISVQKTDGKKTHSYIIEDIGKLVKNTLIKFYQNVKTKPLRIIFYRDGLSEGQYHHVMMYEVSEIKKACASLEVGYNPTITYVVCQKRHHTRLYCANPRDAQDRSGNVPAGTVVDRDITSPVTFDFYLNSHQGIQGTNKPAKYTVLVDENKLPADMLYTMTYHLCHVYARCTRSVSVPAPVYYARLATERAREHLGKFVFDDSDGASSTVSGGAGRGPRGPNIEEVLKAISPHDSTKNKMYWV